MKSIKTLSVLLLTGATCYGALYNYNSSPGQTIPDGNPGGFQDTITVSGIEPVLQSLIVYINVTGGFNGDLYAYLYHEGSSVTLLGRIGSSDANPFGSSTAGFGDGLSTYNNGGTYYGFKLDDLATGGVHDAAGNGNNAVVGGYQPYSSMNTTFAGNPNGNWTIFFADMAGGGGDSSSSLASWGLGIEVVPEPVNVALGIFGGMGVVLIGGRWLRSRCNAPTL